MLAFLHMLNHSIDIPPLYNTLNTLIRFASDTGSYDDLNCSTGSILGTVNGHVRPSIGNYKELYLLQPLYLKYPASSVKQPLNRLTLFILLRLSTATFNSSFIATQ